MPKKKDAYLMDKTLKNLMEMRIRVNTASLKDQSLADKLELQKLHSQLTDIQSALRLLYYEYENAEILYYKPSPVEFWDGLEDRQL